MALRGGGARLLYDAAAILCMGERAVINPPDDGREGSKAGRKARDGILRFGREYLWLGTRKEDRATWLSF